jgi:hypothetical protein
MNGKGDAMTRIKARRRRFGRMWAVLVPLALLAAATIAGGAQATSAAAPQSNSQPTITGQAREGKTLTAQNGTWGNTPTGFTYQWQQCDGSGAGCNPISGATSKTYSVASGDVDHKLRVAVTATNADGSSSATSAPTDAVSSKSGPANTAAPTISGTAKVGEELQAQNGTWTGGVKSYGYQWQRCDKNGASCQAVDGATARTYGVRTIDTGNTLRVVVTATNLSGSTNATSAPTALVGGNTPPPVVAKNHAPTIHFVGLRRLGGRIYARFSVCDDSAKAVTVIERDSMPGRLGYVRRFSVAPQPCGTHARNWKLIPRFHHHGRFTASLHAVDKSGASSRTTSRSLFFTSGV